MSRNVDKTKRMEAIITLDFCVFFLRGKMLVVYPNSVVRIYCILIFLTHREKVDPKNPAI